MRERKVLTLEKKNNVVMDDKMVIMTLVRWDDRGEEMNQEETDQDVAGEVS